MTPLGRVLLTCTQAKKNVILHGIRQLVVAGHVDEGTARALCSSCHLKWTVNQDHHHYYQHHAHKPYTNRSPLSATPGGSNNSSGATRATAPPSLPAHSAASACLPCAVYATFATEAIKAALALSDCMLRCGSSVINAAGEVGEEGAVMPAQAAA